MENPIYTQLHLGVGSFHRAHQAVYQQKLHDQGDEQWQIVGGNIRPDMKETMDALSSQGGSFTLETVSPEGERRYEHISSIRAIIDWDEDLRGLAEVAAKPETGIISFTVTEAGYYLDEHDQLDKGHPDLKTDIAGQTRCTIYGAMAVLLTERKKQSGQPVTLLCCDNLRNNGSRFFSGLMQFLALKADQDLTEWVKHNTSSPCSMVDRITPRPPPELRKRVLDATGRDDSAPIMSENFIQWVIEDDFIAGRPAWEKVDVTMVANVTPFEEAKIRLLNATHSCIAWAGTLRGYDFIHEGLADPDIKKMAFDYVTDDVIPCLESKEFPYPLNLANYRDVVLERFGNSNIQDTNQRVSMDGYSKIPGFILPTIEEALDAGKSIAAVSMLPALFLAFLQQNERGKIPYTYHDTVTGINNAQSLCRADDVITAYTEERLLFGHLAGNQELHTAIQKAYTYVIATFIQTD